MECGIIPARKTRSLPWTGSNAPKMTFGGVEDKGQSALSRRLAPYDRPGKLPKLTRVPMIQVRFSFSSAPLPLLRRRGLLFRPSPEKSIASPFAV